MFQSSCMRTFSNSSVPLLTQPLTYLFIQIVCCRPVGPQSISKILLQGRRLLVVKKKNHRSQVGYYRLYSETKKKFSWEMNYYNRRDYRQHWLDGWKEGRTHSLWFSGGDLPCPHPATLHWFVCLPVVFDIFFWSPRSTLIYFSPSCDDDSFPSFGSSDDDT